MESCFFGCDGCDGDGFADVEGFVPLLAVVGRAAVEGTAVEGGAEEAADRFDFD